MGGKRFNTWTISLAPKKVHLIIKKNGTKRGLTHAGKLYSLAEWHLWIQYFMFYVLNDKTNIGFWNSKQVENMLEEVFFFFFFCLEVKKVPILQYSRKQSWWTQNQSHYLIVKPQFSGYTKVFFKPTDDKMCFIPLSD